MLTAAQLFQEARRLHAETGKIYSGVLGPEGYTLVESGESPPLLVMPSEKSVRPKIRHVPPEAYAMCEACPEAGAACPNGLCKTCGDVMKIVIQVPCKLNKWKFIEESNGL